MVTATLAKFGLHVGNTKLNTQKEERLRVRTIIGIILPACFYIRKSKLTIRETSNKNAIHNIGWDVAIFVHFY